MTPAASSASSLRTLVMASPASARSKSPPKSTQDALTGDTGATDKSAQKRSSIPTASTSSPASSPSHTPPSFPFYDGTGTESDPYVVDWHGHDDPEDPHRWSMWWKSSIVGTAAVSTFCVAYTSSAYAGALRPLQQFFGSK